jgi:hypothetical protein
VHRSRCGETRGSLVEENANAGPNPVKGRNLSGIKELEAVRERLQCGEQMEDFSQFTKTFHKGMFVQFYRGQSKGIPLALFGHQWYTQSLERLNQNGPHHNYTA